MKRNRISLLRAKIIFVCPMTPLGSSWISVLRTDGHLWASESWEKAAPRRGKDMVIPPRTYPKWHMLKQAPSSVALLLLSKSLIHHLIKPSFMSEFSWSSHLWNVPTDMSRGIFHALLCISSFSQPYNRNQLPSHVPEVLWFNYIDVPGILWRMNTVLIPSACLCCGEQLMLYSDSQNLEIVNNLLEILLFLY